MRSFLALTFVGIGSTAFAQVPVMQSLPGGTPVGTAYAPMPVGTQLPQVGTRLPPLGRPPAGATDPSIGNFNPSQSTSPDPNAVIAPYPTSTKPADKSFWDNVYDRWVALFSTNSPPPVQKWTPGIARRNRERAEARFVRD
jgi:hypothetical protein